MAMPWDNSFRTWRNRPDPRFIDFKRWNFSLGKGGIVHIPLPGTAQRIKKSIGHQTDRGQVLPRLPYSWKIISFHVLFKYETS